MGRSEELFCLSGTPAALMIKTNDIHRRGGKEREQQGKQDEKKHIFFLPLTHLYNKLGKGCWHVNSYMKKKKKILIHPSNAAVPYPIT